MTAIKERPILFSGPMVRAILEGRKTVTRRALRTQPVLNGSFWELGGAGWSAGVKSITPVAGHSLAYLCPYGQPGDRLWVRESWWQAGDWQCTYPEDDEGTWFGSRRVVYSADAAPPNEPNHHYPNGLRNGKFSAAEPHVIWRHRPSIHMPRWACRILLEITDIRVERLQDMNEDQAMAEGVRQMRDESGTWVSREGPGNLVTPWLTAKEAFADLWGSINGADSWSANPWVWVVEFKRIEQ